MLEQWPYGGTITIAITITITILKGPGFMARIPVAYKLRLGFGLVEMAISTNQKSTIYRKLYENAGP